MAQPHSYPSLAEIRQASGRLAGKGHVDALTSDAMASMMIGAQELTKAPARSGEFGAPRLEIKCLSALDDAGQPALHEVSLAVREGEIVGVAGVGKRVI